MVQLGRADSLRLSTLVVLALWMCHGAESGTVPLQEDFYVTQNCPQAESIAFETLKNLILNDPLEGPALPARLLRLHHHDCFVRGCDGSVLLDVPKSEKTAPINIRLMGFEAIDAIKLELEKACPGVVSCADILAFAARDSVILSDGPSYKVPAGRRDGSVSLASEAAQFLPDPQTKVPQLVASFANVGLSQAEMVVLSGAHTIGEAACRHIDSRIYDYPGNGGVDPDIPSDYAKKLKKKCRTRGDFKRRYSLDATTDVTFDEEYYKNLVAKTGLLVSDQALYNDAATRALVESMAKSPAVFFDSFGKAMVKMGSIRVLTGTDGEIRKQCSSVNK